MNETIRYAFNIKSEPIPEWLERQMQERVTECRATQAAQAVDFKESRFSGTTDLLTALE